MLAKIVVVGLLFVIIASLGSGLFFMLRDGAESTRAVKALSWRIGLSILAFLLLLLFGWAGWIQPNA